MNIIKKNLSITNIKLIIINHKKPQRAQENYIFPVINNNYHINEADKLSNIIVLLLKSIIKKYKNKKTKSNQFVHFRYNPEDDNKINKIEDYKKIYLNYEYLSLLMKAAPQENLKLANIFLKKLKKSFKDYLIPNSIEKQITPQYIIYDFKIIGNLTGRIACFSSNFNNKCELHIMANNKKLFYNSVTFVTTFYNFSYLDKIIQNAIENIQNYFEYNKDLIENTEKYNYQ